MLTLYRSFTLSKFGKNKLYSKVKLDNSKKIILVERSNYEDLLTEVMRQEAQQAPMVYNLPESYLSYITFIARKIRLKLSQEIGELVDNYSLPDDIVQDTISLDARIKEED